MPTKATLTGKTAGGVAVSSFVINDIRGYSVDFEKLQLTVIRADGSTYSIDLGATGTITLTTSMVKTTGTYSVTCSVA